MKINDRIVVIYPEAIYYHGRIGKIIGKRGDHKKGDPYFTVLLDNWEGDGATPLPASKLRKC